MKNVMTRWLGLIGTLSLLLTLPVACGDDSEATSNAGGGGSGGAGGSAQSNGSGGSGGASADPRVREICEIWMTCIGGNALDVEACVASQVARAEHARVSGCGDSFEAALDCMHGGLNCAFGELSLDPACEPLDAAAVTCLENASEAHDPAPSSSEEAIAFCALVDACSTLTTLELWQCQIDFDETTAKAEALQCGAEAAASNSCAIDNNSCNEGLLEVDAICNSNWDAMAQCMYEASDIGQVMP